MHDAAPTYDRDTYVLDVDDYRQTPSLPRVATEELEMQVYVEGAWHRRMPDLSETACELRIDSQRSPVRRNELRGDLCPICHTAAEMERADDTNRKDLDP